MRRQPVLVCLLLAASSVLGSCQAITTPSSASAASKALSGVWYESDWDFKPNSVQRFSWGESPVAGNNTLIIDCDDGTGALMLPALGYLPVRNVEKVGDNLYRLRFSDQQGTVDAVWLVHHDPEADTIWFSDLKFYEPGTDKELRGGRLIPDGPENVYRRVGGPPR
jgi:hypothetical protein